MIEDLVLLKPKFIKISEQGWIESKRNGTTGIGYTFEYLIGKEEESFPIPDFGTIEIKTRFRNAKTDITLFNVTPDGDYLFPMKRIYEKYSFPSMSDPNFNVFYANISTKARHAGKNFKFKLLIDRKNQKIRVIAIDRDWKSYDTKVSWSFDFLKEKLERKLKYLAIIKANCKNYNGKQYFHYNQINFYMLKDFNTFINLIENGMIKTTFMIGVYKTGVKKGQMNSHGVGFDIAESNLEKLFINIC